MSSLAEIDVAHVVPDSRDPDDVRLVTTTEPSGVGTDASAGAGGQTARVDKAATPMTTTG